MKKCIVNNLYYFNDFENIDENKLRFLYTFLPLDRKIRVDKAYYKKDKIIKILEYFIVKNALNLKGEFNFKYNKNGKPYVNNKLHFNISHSDSMLVVAVDSENVGVDVEPFIKFDDKLARFICNKKEYNKIINAKNKSLELTKLWTQKESLIKFKGITIAHNLKTLLKNKNLYNFEFEIFKDCVVCVCKKNKI